MHWVSPTRYFTRARTLIFMLTCGLIATPIAGQQPATQVQTAPSPRAIGGSTPSAVSPVAGQMAVLGQEAYLTPPKVIADAVLASRGDHVTLTRLSPDGKKFLILRRDSLPALDRLGCPCVHLAEMAFDPVACRARDLWVNSSEGFDLFYPIDQRKLSVQVPKGARVTNPVWSPDGSKLAFYAMFPEATHIFIADTETGYSRQITTTPVLATLVSSFQWSNDGKRIQTVLLPDDGKRPTPKPTVATEPKVRVARDGKDPSRTYRYLLESPYQVQLLEHLLTGQLALINVADGAVTKVGCPNMIRSVSTAPGESQFRVATVKKPFSYFVPFTRFGSTEGIWDLEGKSLFTLSDRNLRETEPVAPVVTNPTPKTPGQPSTRSGGPRGGAPGTPPTPKQPPTKADDPPAPPATTTDPDGKRDLAWRPDGEGFSFLQQDTPEAKDEKAPRNDRVMKWLPPFGKEDVRVVYETPNRIAAVQYSEDAQWLFLTQTVGGQRQITAIDLKDPKTPFVISRGGPGTPKSDPKKGNTPTKTDPPPETAVWDEDAEGGDEQPPSKGPREFGGSSSGLMTRTMATGVNVVRISSAGDVYITGSERGRGAGATAFPRPYIEAINIKTGKKTRIFEGQGELLETIDAVDGDTITRVYTNRQNTRVVPDSFMTELPSGKVTKLTANVDRSPWFHDIKVERIRVTRVDGFKFWAKVTLPPNAKGKLPALFWIYPREYSDQAAYDSAAGRTGGAGAGGSGRFATPGPRNMAILTLAGYAVIEPDVPIVGPAGRMNDNYVPDLRNSLWAVIDELDKRGIIDRDRLSCGGHSYGAFSTANAMAHTPFFKAGIAGDGCYNRTLTSMSFQSERRQLWDARETYLEMSPLLWADRVNGALLMYHGMEDANVGTNPINSEHLFAALDGLGKDAAMYMYPYEGHGPITKETTLDLWARWIAWLDLYVMNPKTK